MSSLSMLNFRRSIFAAVLAFAPVSSACHAQDTGMASQVNVPFAFATGSQHFAPGVYRIRMENDHTVMIAGASGSFLALARTEDNAETVKAGKATFHKYGAQYFLSAIMVAGDSRQIYLTPCKVESELRKGHKRTAPASVELALLKGSRY